MKEKILSWLKIARLQFYPMTFIAYSLGATLAQRFSLHIFLLGYAILFLIELCTILTNEYYDLPSDRINSNASPFNGGSRVLVEGKLRLSEVKSAILIILGLIVITSYLLIITAQDNYSSSIVIMIMIGIFFGLGYTVPPLKFCYRGWGEVVVGSTHSLYVILCGYVFQTGTWNNPLLWFLSFPLFFAVLGAISLSSLPDYNADKSVGKKTIAVTLGPKLAAIMSISFIAMAAFSAIIFSYFRIITYHLSFIVIPHSLILGVAISRFIKTGNYNRKINGIMQLALSYIIWFGIVPLVSLLYGFQ